MRTRNNIGFIFIFSLFSIYLILNGFRNGFSFSGMFGYGMMTELSFFGILTSVLIGVLYLSLAGCFIVFIGAFAQIKRVKYLWLVIIVYIFFVALSGYPGSHCVAQGRYFDILFPLLLIGVLTYKWREDRRLVAIGAVISIFSLVTLRAFSFDTISSFSNVYYYLPDFMFIILPVIAIIFLTRVRNEKITKIGVLLLLICVFIAGNVVNFQYVKSTSNNAYENAVIGRYISAHKITNLTFDKSDYEVWWASYCLMCYYNKGFIPLTNNTSRYFISSQKLQYNILAKQKHYKQLEEGANKTLYLYKCTN